MRGIARRLALRLDVRGLMNVQFARHRGDLYVLEVNPRASRTVPFIASGGVAAGRIAARDGGRDAGRDRLHRGAAGAAGVRQAPVFPFKRFPGFDPVLGPR